MDRLAALTRRTARRLAGQAGFALVASLGISVILGISGTTAIVYSTENARSASASKADERTFSLAEAGLNYAYSTLYNASDPTMPGAVPRRTEPAGGGTIEYFGTLDTQTNVWTLTGVGHVPNPEGGVEIIRSVHGRVSVGTSQHGTGNNAIWNYVYADSLTGCTTLRNSVNINVPLYIRGNLCLRNSAQVSGYALQVGGTLTIENEAHVGTVLAPIPEAHIAGGCTLNGGPLNLLCGVVDHVWATTVDRNPTGLVKPPVDLAGWYANAKPGPRQACTSGSFPGGFDNDTLMNRSLATDVDLTPDTAYDCQVRDVQGNLLGRIAWTPGSPGTLTIAGTIFFDGNISFRNEASAVYQGRATIYASGTITLRNSSTLCGVAGCNSSWQATQNLLAFVAGSSTDSTGFTVENSATFQGAVYAVNDYTEVNSATVWGPIIARQIFLQNSSTNHYVPLGVLMPGMPASYAEAVTLTNEPGSWS